MTTIVVGVDDSPQARRALQWAIDEARVREATLIAVHAMRTPLVAHTPVAAVMAAEQARVQEPPLDRIVESTDAGDVEVERRSRAGDAAGVLIEIAQEEDADLLVVGSRGHGGFMGLLLGSVSATLAHHSPCPLVIVPGADADAA
jgi:nucleotide-binding universal stress UspA family protein